MNKGHVYILTNASMPGIVKVGKTAGLVSDRCRALQGTGVPTPFEVFYSVFAPDCSGLEAAVHRRLSDCRVSGNREFFRTPPTRAMKILDEEHVESVELMLDEFLPCHVPVPSGDTVSSAKIMELADALGVCGYDIVSAMGLLSPEEIRPALKRWTDKLGGAWK